jgi:hypothetical protein
MLVDRVKSTISKKSPLKEIMSGNNGKDFMDLVYAPTTDSSVTVTCSNKMNSSSSLLFEDTNVLKNKFSKRIPAMMKSPLKSPLKPPSLRKRTMDPESRLDDVVETEGKRSENECRDINTGSGASSLNFFSENHCISVEDTIFKSEGESNKEKTKGRSKLVSKTSKKTIGKIKNMFKNNEKKKDIDMDIGIKLALPDKLGVMRGLEAPSASSPTNSGSSEKDRNSIMTSTPQKKLMILPDQSPYMLKKRISSMSPFKKDSKRKMKALGNLESARNEISTNPSGEIVLRSSEHDPSVHQMTIPTATEVLIHARVCALLEGYDQLLETRAKAGKRWFSFGDLVGLNRLDLKNIYLSAIGQKPEIPLFIGENAHQPPPLPKESAPFGSCSLGNPFETHPNEMGSLSSLTISSESTGSFKKKGGQGRMKAMKPHPSTIKSLLECADDIVVEGYFTETIGHDIDSLEGAEATGVQVAILSSDRQREFIVCFRGSMAQHAKPIKSKGVPKVDSNGGALHN